MTDALWLSARISAQRSLAATQARDADILLRNALNAQEAAREA